jgi:hypothetical protein
MLLCVCVEDEGGFMKYTSIPDIGVPSLFKNEHYYIVPGKYGRSCSPPTVFDVAWSQPMRNVDSKTKRWHHETKLSVIFCSNLSSLGMIVQLLDFTVGSLVKVVHRESSSFDPESGIKFFKCLRYKIAEQIYLTEGFRIWLIR